MNEPVGVVAVEVLYLAVMEKEPLALPSIAGSSSPALGSGTIHPVPLRDPAAGS
jgi:hypothetical protein